MKTLFVAINAKYIHTNLAVRYMHELAKKNGYKTTDIAEYTINQRLPQLLRELYLTKANHMVFSCYIWNIDMILDLCCQLKQVMPHTKILLAGPEVSYNSAEMMEQYTFIDGIIRGEGETALIPLLEHLQFETPASVVPSFTYRNEHQILETEQASPISLSELPFPYPDLEKEKGRILYFECSRGCPFRCGYCLSSIEKGVRFMPLEQVYHCLDIFLSKRVPQVKFVDRTFNCNKNYALSIWKYLKEHDNGITNFHFEIAGDLLDEKTIAFLSTVRKEQFQFEVGVQSTNAETLSAITRKTNTEKLLQICKEIDSFGNIHLHLDLIAGLPFEDIRSFKNSFNQVFQIHPQQLQLGFLKVLKGSSIHRESGKYGILYTSKAPFEVLQTNWLSFDDVLFLKDIESMVELYYNSGRFQTILSCMIKEFKTPFDFFAQLGSFYTAYGYHLSNHSKEQYYEILCDFWQSTNRIFTETMKQLCIYDICLHEKPKKLPAFTDNVYQYKYRDWISKFYELQEHIQTYLPNYTSESAKRIAKIVHMQVFPFHPETQDLIPTAVLFDYQKRDLTGKAYHYFFPLSK